MKYILILVSILFFSCKEDKMNISSSQRGIAIDYTVEAFSKIQEENDTIINTFKKCINSKEYIDYANFWDNSDNRIFSYPYADLYTVINDGYPEYLPTVIALQKIKTNKYLFKIAIMSPTEKFSSLSAIYNIYAIRNQEGKFVFQNTINEILKTWNIKTINNIEYFFSKEKIFDSIQVKKQIDFENKLVNLLEVEKIDYKFIICKSIYETYKIRGYDFEPSMYLNNQIGGISFQAQKIIFSGNNSAYYPHELVHIYVYQNFPNTHIIINEGIATYLGGSKGLKYDEHIKLLNDYLLKENINVYDYLFDDYKRYTLIGENSSIMYTCGAFLCDLAFKKKGREGLLDLLKKSDSTEELILTIETLFNINKENFDSFFKKELKNHLSK